MAIETWIWISGLTAQADHLADFPEYDSLGQPPFPNVVRSPSGLSLSPLVPNLKYAFYVPVTTPTILDGSYMLASRVVCLFKATDVQIDTIEIYDGDLIQGFTNLGLSGDHGTRDASNTFTISSKKEVTSGVVVKIGASFMPSSQPGAVAGTLQIQSVGVSFESGETVWGRFVRLVASLFGG